MASEDRNLLRLYYKEHFPMNQIHQWLRADRKNGERREISLTLAGDRYYRRVEFCTINDFRFELFKNLPIKIDVGCIYQSSAIKTDSDYVKKEICFDIDLSDYDDVRTCCAKDAICIDCWKYLIIASKILNEILINDFGYKHLLWTFSGRRGIHCWICDENARLANKRTRCAIMEYIKSIQLTLRDRSSSSNLHPAQKRALKVIDNYFIDFIIRKQKVLDDRKRLDKFYEQIPINFREQFKCEMDKCTSSEARWYTFVKMFDEMKEDGEIPKYLTEEIKFHYTYPRFDEIITKDRKHLLKCPFSMHPVTGKFNLPFSIGNVDHIDPCNLPTITSIFEEKEVRDKYVESVRLFEEFLSNLGDETA